MHYPYERQGEGGIVAINMQDEWGLNSVLI